MQFSKKVADLARLHNVDPKDVFFAMLIAAGANPAEAFAVIFRPSTSTNNALSKRAAQYIDQRPGLAKLIARLNSERLDPLASPQDKPAKRGRPAKAASASKNDDGPIIDYSEKDAVLKELSRIVDRSETKDKIQALKAIADINRLKQEQNKAEEKTVHFYIPLTYDRAEELRQLLAKYYANPQLINGIGAISYK